MHRSFILFTKCELKTYVILGTFSQVTSLLRVIVSLTGVACSAGNTYIKYTDIDYACTKATCTKDAYIRVASIGDAYARDTYARGTYAVKYSGIYLQPFQISEMKLFGTGLETGILAG